MTVKTERRTQLRKRPLSLVYVELPPANGGMMRDLSEYGFSLRAMMPLRQSEKLPFSFALDSGARIDGEAIVVRLDDDGHVATLEFAGLPPHSRDQIRRWLEKFDEPLSPESATFETSSTKHSSLTELRTQIRAARPTSVTPQSGESGAAPPQELAPPPKQEAPPPQVALPLPVPTPAVESTAPSPLHAESAPAKTKLDPPPPSVQLPLETAQADPRPESTETVNANPPSQQEIQPLTLPARQPDEPHTLPPLLRLSAVRLGPPPTEVSSQPVVSDAIPKSVEEPSSQTRVRWPIADVPPARVVQAPAPPAFPRVASRRGPAPALEPLSSIEGETDSLSPGWMDRFTLGRAIGIMLFLTLLAASYVYHRELGQALIWLGHQIEGEESLESSKPAQPAVSSPARAIPESSASARTVQPPPPGTQQSPSSIEPKDANPPSASEVTPSSQLKGGTPRSLVPLTQVARPPAPAPPAENSDEPGQQEYLQALQILRAPNRSAELPQAIQLLWVAVEKGNTSAEIDLAELFHQGRGVSKNCAQTRILLSAAARKGSAEARKRLEAFRREGCTE